MNKYYLLNRQYGSLATPLKKVTPISRFVDRLLFWQKHEYIAQLDYSKFI